MMNQQLTEELKVLLDMYTNGELEGDKLRKLQNLLFVAGESIGLEIEQEKKNKQKEAEYATT
ncbi:hypothetical protein [Priestia megaterium]|uniref:hypothetical protein n=1 Tax=Priestia megaterium TaxID=1404 RepID=UPI000BFD196C|nr:hypothetical protein [Priestia megaterium]PGQ88175.1 hypothetical protein COA18_04425 [Priestia megaterium]